MIWWVSNERRFGRLFPEMIFHYENLLAALFERASYWLQSSKTQKRVLTTAWRQEMGMNWVIHAGLDWNLILDVFHNCLGIPFFQRKSSKKAQGAPTSTWLFLASIIKLSFYRMDQMSAGGPRRHHHHRPLDWQISKSNLEPILQQLHLYRNRASNDGRQMPQIIRFQLDFAHSHVYSSSNGIYWAGGLPSLEEEKPKLWHQNKSNNSRTSTMGGAGARPFSPPPVGLHWLVSVSLDPNNIYLLNRPCSRAVVNVWWEVCFERVVITDILQIKPRVPCNQVDFLQ